MEDLNMNAISFHVYRDDEVIAVDVPVSELENILLKEKNLSAVDVMPLQEVEYDDASY
tara:strand:- start:810 stop:983 length:174 start_codon:yes stop_codon:yes gene_type:complete